MGDREGQAESRRRASARRKAGSRARRRRLAAGPAAFGHRHLLDVVEKGAVVRKHQFFADMRKLLLPALVSGLVQCAVYAGVIVHAGRSDWGNLAIVCGLLLAGTVSASILLSAFRTREFPFTLSAGLTLVVFNFVVVVLSAMRIAISYTGLLWCFPVALVGMVLAATRLSRASSERIAVLAFPGADPIAARLGPNARVIALEDTSLTDYDTVVIDTSTHFSATWHGHMLLAQMRGVHIEQWLSALERMSGRVAVEHFQIAHMAYSPLQVYYTRIKRLADLLLVAILLPVVVPIGALTWLYIRIIDGGPSLFVQTRRGYGGKAFRMYKFRTMAQGTHGGSTAANDTRILPGCRMLRRFRIDELPQLINIVRGEMSWIGPRPVSLEVSRTCERLSEAYPARYMVLPGITGWAQVMYGYAGTPEEEMEKLSYDLYYLKRISLDLDLEITFRTIRTMLTWSGAR